MNLRELLLLALVGWTVLGVVGVLISWVRARRGVVEEQGKVARGVSWLVGIWLVYLSVLVGVSVEQPQRVVAIGQEQCFDEMCFAAMGVDEVPRFLGPGGVSDGSRLVRVAVKVRNKARGAMEREKLIRAYLVDGQGRRWDESSGVSGNSLAGRVGAGAEMMSEPIFKVASDATGLELVFTHGRWQPGVLVIGDSDSWGHRRTVVKLGR